MTVERLGIKRMEIRLHSILIELEEDAPLDGCDILKLYIERSREVLNSRDLARRLTETGSLE